MYVYGILKLKNMDICIGIFVFWKLIYLFMYVYVLVYFYYIVWFFLINLKKVVNWDGFRIDSLFELCV